MIETIKVSSKGQIVIPELIREQLEIKEGMRLILINDEGKIILPYSAKVVNIVALLLVGLLLA